MIIEEVARLTLIAAITALAAEDADRRIQSAVEAAIASPSKEAKERVDLARYHRRVIEHRDAILELGIAADPESDPAALRRLREVRERRLAKLAEDERLVTDP